MHAFDSPPTHGLLSRRLVRPSATLGVLFLLAAIAGGVLTHSVVSPAPVLAACHSANQTCTGGGAATKTAVFDVSYFVPGASSVTPIEPNSTTSFSVTAYWGEAPGGNCTDVVQAGSVDVSWNGTNWVTSSFNGTADILQVGICTLVSCSGLSNHSSSYRLYFDIDDPAFGTVANLRQVILATTSVPNGTDYNSSTCVAGTSHTPTGSSFSSTDTGTFECAFDCNGSGPTLSITYN